MALLRLLPPYSEPACGRKYERHLCFTFGIIQLPDVCYSWWVLASLKIIGRIRWIDKDKLRKFILACQDEETGGFADRPGDMVRRILRIFEKKSLHVR